MSNCSINTECHLDDLVSAIQDISDARDADLSHEEEFLSSVSTRFFSTHYPRLSDAIATASLLIEDVEEKDHRNRTSLPAIGEQPSRGRSA
jgi:hypothetical protein